MFLKEEFVMKDYIVKKINIEDYDRFVLCLSCESVLVYLNEIETAPIMKKFSGKIIIDQLLITGDGNNRFMSCYFTDGKLDRRTAKVVTPSNLIRKKTVELLHDNYSTVENSILSEVQRKNIKDKILF